MNVSKNKIYPPQTGAYSVKVKNGAGWSEFKTVRLQISVGQEYHEGEKLKATLKWAKHRFDEVIICVNDTLQRHNYLFEGYAEDEALSKAEQAGREWIERNISMIRHLPNYKIYRWQDWRQNEDFKATFDIVKKLRAQDFKVMSAIDTEIDIFWERKKAKTNLSENRYYNFYEHSLNYLLEECAAFYLMFKKNEAVDVYPGSSLLPCFLLRGEANLGQRAFTRIDFSRNEKTYVDRPNDSLNQRSR